VDVSKNLLLAALSPGDLAALRPFLRLVSLNQRQVLFEAGGEVNTVYFPVGAVVSLVVGLSDGNSVEGAAVGRDGVVGAACALDGKTAFLRGIVQMAGEAFTCPASAVKAAALQSVSLLETLVRHEQIMFAESQQSTACMAAHHAEARLARWLLRARDLSGNEGTLALTQEFLAEMLGVQRTSVTLAAGTLQRAGLIHYARGKVDILNVEALRDTACECYETISAHHQELL